MNAAPLLPGTLLEQRYRVLYPLARGGMGAVYEAEDLRLRRRVALKVLRPELLRDPVSRERLRREALATAAVQHPALVAVYDLQLDAEPAFLVMELLEGQSLAELLAAEGRLGWRRLLPLLAEVLLALQRLHDAGVVHRDLKPANVMVVRDGAGERARLIDLGIAQLESLGEEPRLTGAGTLVGTPAFMAPEQLAGGAVGPAADLWAAGVVLFTALAGYRPFAASELGALLEEVRAAEPPPLRAAVPEAPEALEALLLALLQKSPSARPARASDVASTLLELCGRAPAPQPSAPPPQSVALPASESLTFAVSDASRPAPAAPAPLAPAPPAPPAPSAPPARAPLPRVVLVLAGLSALLALAVLALLWRPWAEDAEQDAPVPVNAAQAAYAPATVSFAPLRPTRLDVQYLASSPAQEGRVLAEAAPTFTPRLRACVELSAHRYAETVAVLRVDLPAQGMPTALPLSQSTTPAEQRCLEAAVRAQAWPAGLGGFTVRLTALQ